MLFGIGQQAKKETPQKASSDAVIFDVAEQDFETKVLKASLSIPVLVDFWAPWCGPCKQLGPALEKAVQNAGGKVVLAKINVDENQQIAQAFRVQSIPMVVALYQGQPVTAFSGVRSQAEIEKLITQLIALHNQNQPDAIDIPASLKQAAEFLNQQNYADAQNLYAGILAQDQANVQAYLGIIRVMIGLDKLDDAQALITQAPEIITKDPQFKSAQTALDLARTTPAGDIAVLEKKAAAHADDPQIQFDLAMAYFAATQKDKAVDILVALIRKNRAWEDEKARKQLLQFFEAWGPVDPATVSGRRKLSAVLFS